MDWIFDKGVVSELFPSIRKNIQTKPIHWTWLFDEKDKTLCRSKNGATTEVVITATRSLIDNGYPLNWWYEWDIPEQHLPMFMAWGYGDAHHLVLAEYIEEGWPECPDEFYQIVRQLAFTTCPQPEVVR